MKYLIIQHLKKMEKLFDFDTVICVAMFLVAIEFIYNEYKLKNEKRHGRHSRRNT